MILGLDAANSGTATVNERPYAEQPAPLKAVGALLDPGAVLPSRTAYHHLLALAAGNGIPRGRVDDVLAEVGLENVGRRRAGTFSLGMRQRLGIAAALLGDPPVLVFDEPLNGLDPEGIVWIRSLMRRMAAEGRAAGCAETYGFGGPESSPLGGHLRVARTGDRTHAPPAAGRQRVSSNASPTARSVPSEGELITLPFTIVVTEPPPSSAMARTAPSDFISSVAGLPELRRVESVTASVLAPDYRRAAEANALPPGPARRVPTSL